MMRSLSRPQAVGLGLTVALGLGLSATGLFALGSRQGFWGEHFVIQTHFPQIRGVEPGTRVRIQGIDAGEVVGIKPPVLPGQEVSLCLRLDRRFQQLVRADACAKIVHEGMVGGKVVEIEPGTTAAPPVGDNAQIAGRSAVELTDALEQLSREGSQTLKEVRDGFQNLSRTLQEVRNGEGTLGKEMKLSLREINTTLHDLRNGEGAVGKELIQSLQQFRRTLTSIKQDVDALQQMPLVGSYVRDPNKKLIRPECERQRRWFHETDLFEPGQARLSSEGRKRLDETAPWLNDFKAKGVEIVVAAYGEQSWSAERARIVTQKQSEAVCTYLKNQHAVHKAGWFSRGEVTPLGCGIETSPVPDPEELPYPRVEVVVFLPPS